MIFLLEIYLKPVESINVKRSNPVFMASFRRHLAENIQDHKETAGGAVVTSAIVKMLEKTKNQQAVGI